MTLDQITPLVLTYNEGPNISRCLERLGWADRVIVLDSLSTDDTKNLARAHANVAWLERPFDDHTSQWNAGIDQVKTEWVLALDADYVLTDLFEGELRALEAPDDVAAFYAKFHYVIFGKALRGSLYPPRAVLFRKSRCRYENDGHTQLLRIAGRSGSLDSVILHDDRKSLSRWFQSQDKYAQLEAEKLLSASAGSLRTQDRLRLALVPAAPLALLYALFVRGAVLDGWRGWYYALQRMLAETMLALRLLEKKFTSRS